MSNTKEIKVNITSSSTHRGPEKSTTLNRRYVKRPTKILIEDSKEEIVENLPEPVEEIIETPKVEYHKTSKIEISDSEIDEAKAEAKISHIAPVEVVEEEDVVSEPEVVTPESEDIPPAPNPYQEALDKKKAERDRQLVAEISSKALKEAAIKKALAEMKSEEELKKTAKVSRKAKKEEKTLEKVMRKELKSGVTGKKAEKLEKLSKKQAKKIAKNEAKIQKHIKKGRTGRIILAFAASAACMIALAALVKVNLPNISISVAAAQTGVEASYPNNTPRDFTLSGVYTNDNSVIIEFVGPNETGFTISEERTSWDSNALITNYVKGAFGKDYETVTESETTIYISHSNAAWIKDNTLYKLTASAGTLTKRQIKNIVTSL